MNDSSPVRNGPWYPGSRSGWGSLKASRLASNSALWRPAVANKGWPRLVEGCGECGSGCCEGVGPEGVCLPISGFNFRFGEEVFGPAEAGAACLLTVTSCHMEAGGLLMESGDGLVLEHHMEFEALAILDLLNALATALALFLLMS